jgi:hypothetical protein
MTGAGFSTCKSGLGRLMVRRRPVITLGANWGQDCPRDPNLHTMRSKPDSSEKGWFSRSFHARSALERREANAQNVASNPSLLPESPVAVPCDWRFFICLRPAELEVVRSRSPAITWITTCKASRKRHSSSDNPINESHPLSEEGGRYPLTALSLRFSAISL